MGATGITAHSAHAVVSVLQVSRPARTTLPSVPNNLSFELVVGVRSLIAEQVIVAFATIAKSPSGQYMPADDKLYIFI